MAFLFLDIPLKLSFLKENLMRKVLIALPATALLLIVCFFTGSASANSSEKISGISASRAADSIHSIIEANRTIYSEVIVERLAVAISLKATENWKNEDTLPLPAQFLALSSHMIKEKGLDINYRLTSLWPINDSNKPKSKFELSALKKVLKDPSKTQTTVTSLNGNKIFTAVYPDLAVTKACVTCHNNHPKSPKRDFKLGDVMGGIVINFPIDNMGKSGKDPLIAPEVVADYLHAVLESDRTVYSKYVVNRLQSKNIAYASEHWWEENALLLPVQFLLNASDLIIEKQLGFDFKLISLWPINNHNGAANEFERKGLDSVTRNPVRPFIGVSKLGGKKYFQALYPDFAVSTACVSCHNAHPKSPKKDFKLNDVMGGVVLTIPVE
ncbi:MAG TPA: hypothetical protein DCX78_10085 [Nitrospina sp.]|jgi:cytochrome c553|nr:DUF3365 domain-containing protein [Nitrospinaceae bacterium]HAX47156.1 hypothetical protein [Nitrospina sp.]|tara:strand:+ start:297 stop:1448 length:1152 start_codon:yes stop_codon:yes gene_type:complete